VKEGGEGRKGNQRQKMTRLPSTHPIIECGKRVGHREQRGGELEKRGDSMEGVGREGASKDKWMRSPVGTRGGRCEKGRLKKNFQGAIGSHLSGKKSQRGGGRRGIGSNCERKEGLLSIAGQLGRDGLNSCSQ